MVSRDVRDYIREECLDRREEIKTKQDLDRCMNRALERFARDHLKPLFDELVRIADEIVKEKEDDG